MKQPRKESREALTPKELELLEECEILSNKWGKFIRKLQIMEANDQRCVALGMEKLQEGVMWCVRGITKPPSF